ncbi:MAG TPA: response regulator transcription factor [Usitatibacter sp.]|nr:response regulator transcription factor [Usitatibacter sp.]
MTAQTSHPSSRAMTVLVVDDHPLFREGLRQVLQGLAGETRVIAEGDAEKALAAVHGIDDLDLVLLDLSMPGMNGFAAVQRFSREAPGVPVVIISAHEEPADIRRALALGALGYIPKSTPPNILLDALRLVMGGGVYVPALFVQATRHAGPPAAPPGAQGEPPGDGVLTGRQADVLVLLSQGKSNKLIARDLELSEKTVKAHVTAVFRALGVVNRTQAALAARRRGLIK